MWTRAGLKEKAKAAFKRNYWMCVIAAVILSFCAGGSSGGSSVDTSSFDSLFEEDVDDYSDDMGYYIDEDGDYVYNIPTNFGDESIVEEEQSFTEMLKEEFGDALPFIGVAASIIGIIIIIAIVVGVLIGAFVLSIVQIGGCRFFTVNAKEDASLKELVYGFTNGAYMRNVGTMFLKGLYEGLWSLLFIIPGIVKSYEYRMIPYILADDPTISRQEAFALSKKMMDGNKWDAFVLDLSFLGWSILTAFTCGILGVFYVNPYIHATDAELYLQLKENVMPSQPVEYDQFGWEPVQTI